MSGPEDDVLYRLRGAVAWVTLNRPAKRNALTERMLVLLERYLLDASRDDGVKVMVLAGAAPSFCAGYDLGVGGTAVRDRPDVWERVLTRDIEATLGLWAFPKPTIAAVQGHCLGGGCEIAMACDMVIAGCSGRFGQPEIRFGAGPATLLTPFVVAEKIAKMLLFTGDTLDAEQAERVGLVNRVVPDKRLTSEVEALSARIATVPLQALRHAKRALIRAEEIKGLRRAVAANISVGALLNAADTPEQREFMAKARSQGLRAALNWRDRRYGES
ncbi:MAG: enoyl-CoA hydratase [Gaiellales bacterium]|jgi:enoyl-CoA hydratase/carnithine racemase|nr:enoyl-CoA hydratase [Gaiellales bacterium]